MNKCVIIGRLTQDPDYRTTTNGIPVCTFTIAVQRKAATANGEKPTDFFSIVVWRKLADTCSKYLEKGKKVAVVGELQNRSYQAKDGSKRYVTEIMAEEVEFLTPKSADRPAEDLEQGFIDVDDEPLPF